MPISRRDFLAMSALGVASLLIPGCASSSSSAALGTPPVGFLTLPTDPPFPASVASAEQAAMVALSMVDAALAQSTFAVGGLIVETNTGRVIQAMHNNVIRKLPDEPNQVFTWDPTAHGERQLVSWYYANASKLSLPPPEELTIVTSLDPCAQCAGSIMTAGFKAGVIAYDDVAGVNYNLQANFLSLPERFRPLASETFGYYAIDPGRRHSGATQPIYSNMAVLAPTAKACLTQFEKSRTVVEQVRTTTNLTPAEMTDPATLSADSPVKTALTQRFPTAFTLRLSDYRRPDAALKQLLLDQRDASPGAKNAVALIDPFGNVVAAAPDTFDVSPINTGFMNVVEGYSQARFELAANPSTKQAGASSLTNPKYGTFVWLHAPSARDTTTIKDLGIYDLTIEGAIPVPNPSNFQYYEAPVSGTEEELLAMIQTMSTWTDPADPQRVAS